MVLLYGVCHMESCFGLFGDSVSLHGTYHLLLDQKPLSKHPMVLLGEEAQVKAQFGLFEDSANLEAVRCTVYMEHTIYSEINLDAPNRTPR